METINEFLELFFRVNHKAFGVEVVVLIVVAHFRRKEAPFNAWDLSASKANDSCVRFRGPIRLKVMEIAPSGTKDNHSLILC
jgi:hypothetical protein